MASLADAVDDPDVYVLPPLHREVDGYLDPTQFPRYRVTYDIEDTGNG